MIRDLLLILKSSYRRCSVEKGVSNNFKKIQGWSLWTPVLESFLNKVAELRAFNFIKKIPARVF